MAEALQIRFRAWHNRHSFPPSLTTMEIKMSYSTAFLAFLVAATGIATVSMTGESREQHKARESVRTEINILNVRYKNSPRLQHLIARQAGLCFSNGYFGTEMCDSAQEPYAFLTKTKLELSADLPDTAVVQVFKDRIILNSLVSEHVQDIALKNTILYVEAQIRDGMDYGVGESFTIGQGELVPVGKNHREFERVLIPGPRH
jgi:hypothetical protein